MNKIIKDNLIHLTVLNPIIRNITNRRIRRVNQGCIRLNRTSGWDIKYVKFLKNSAKLLKKVVIFFTACVMFDIFSLRLSMLFDIPENILSFEFSILDVEVILLKEYINKILSFV